MRARGLRALLTLVIALSIAWVPGVAVAASTVLPLAADDGIPGAPQTSPYSGSLAPASGDEIDVFPVVIGVGEVFSAQITMGAGDSVLAALFPPGTVSLTDGTEDSPVALSNYYNETTDRLTYYSPSGGTYYVMMFSRETAGVHDYTIDFKAAPLGSKGDVAGAVQLPSSISDSLDWRTDPNHVYRVSLAEGDEIRLTQTPSSAKFGELSLLGPDETTVWGSPIAQYDWGDGTDKITYLVPPGGAGEYHVNVWTHIYSGSYTLKSSVSQPDVPRVWGQNRYTTSSAVSKSAWVTAAAAILATGEDAADALAASALAGALDAPVILVPEYEETDDVLGVYYELDRLGVQKVYVVGGSAAVDSSFDSDLKGFGYTVTRLSGSNRYTTAAIIANRVKAIDPQTTVFVVRGDDFADALAVSPYAFSQGYPVLLTKPGTLHPSTEAFIEGNDIRDVVIAGGDAAVSPGVATAIDVLNSGSTRVTRIEGANRYSTASAVARYGVDAKRWATWDFVGVATGESFPDALSGGAACGKRGGALLLTKPTSLVGQTSGTIAAKDPDMVMLFGGPAAVAESVKSSIQSLMP